MSNARTLALPGLVASVFMLVLAPGLRSPGPVAAQGVFDLPAEFYGGGLPDDTEVAAWIGDTLCDSMVVQDGAWLFRLYPGGCDGSAVQGARVTFTVNGVQADQYALWRVAYLPPDLQNGISLTVGGGAVAVGPDDPGAPAERPRLSRGQGLSIFSGGSLDDLEAAVLDKCPGGAIIWANDPSEEGEYLGFTPNPPIELINDAFRTVYPDGFDEPEPVIVTGCTAASGL